MLAVDPSRYHMWLKAVADTGYTRDIPAIALYGIYAIGLLYSRSISRLHILLAYTPLHLVHIMLAKVELFTGITYFKCF